MNNTQQTKRMSCFKCGRNSDQSKLMIKNIGDEAVRVMCNICVNGESGFTKKVK